jgi:hypothetical protein
MPPRSSVMIFFLELDRGICGVLHQRHHLLSSEEYVNVPSVSHFRPKIQLAEEAIRCCRVSNLNCMCLAADGPIHTPSDSAVLRCCSHSLKRAVSLLLSKSALLKFVERHDKNICFW